MGPCECGTGRPLGGGRKGLRFLEGMLSAVPGLYNSEYVDYLVSHPYPYSLAPWGTDKALRGLTYYRNESETVGQPGIPALLGETGWHRSSERGEWTVLAYQQLWLPDTQVLGVCPFLLAGPFWDAAGWPWMNISTTGALVPLPVFNATKQLR